MRGVAGASASPGSIPSSLYNSDNISARNSSRSSSPSSGNNNRTNFGRIKKFKNVMLSQILVICRIFRYSETHYYFINIVSNIQLIVHTKFILFSYKKGIML